MADRDWKKYERQIEDELRKSAAEDAEIQFDVSLQGHKSGRGRQIDIYVRGDFAHITDATMAVDCKCFSRNVNVKDVEAFIGLVEDVGTDFGLLVTTEGHSPAAENRLKAERAMRIQIVPYDELANWQPPFQWCEVCTDFESDRMPGGVWIEPFVEGRIPPGGELAYGAGTCDRCQAIYMECRCGTVNHCLEFELGEWRECEGGCGVEWKAEIEFDRKGTPLTIDAHDQVEFRRP